MHLLVRETGGLDDDAPALEPGQTPAPLLALSFSDADLGALAAAWTPAHPALRLRSLARLRHPMGVDLYLEQVAAGARCVAVRLLGGTDYWRYGAEELAALCRERGIALALLPGDGADDTRLRALSTVPAEAWSALEACLRLGGPDNTGLALDWSAHLAGMAPRPVALPRPVPPFGVLDWAGAAREEAVGRACIVLYRSHHLSADTAPHRALAAALRARGLEVRALYVDSLKSPTTAAWVAAEMAAFRPQVVLNATAFSAPLGSAGAPVLQVVLAGSSREAWEGSSRGLSPADLAMQVVLPELDGRLLTAAISFKAETAHDPALQYARVMHVPDAEGVAMAADRAAAWVRLATTPRAGRRLAAVLSDYPGIGGQQGHAVGLDSFASVEALLADLAADGYAVTPVAAGALVHALCHAAPKPFLSLDAYARLLAALPAAAQRAIADAWGDPAADPAVQDGHFTLRWLEAGAAVVALQPDRGLPADRRAGFHDPDLPPRHVFAAFHLWLRHVRDVHALVQMGAHGSLEWLPGKAAALSAACWPAALLGAVPVAYPFIVNNPGEAAAAKRRLGAVTLGHLTPPLGPAGAHGAARELERLIDEYAAADGLDRRRAGLLRGAILEHAADAGLLAESGAAALDPDAALARLDAYLCDVKELQIRDGLHVFGRPPPGREALLAGLPGPAAALDACAEAERSGLLAALDGRFVAAGPAGAPTRGRADVLPTGRNLSTIDPRALPTRAAMDLAGRAAEALVRRHMQEQGEYPRAVLLDLWGSAAMRTGGEDLALAYVLLGARPTWDDGSARVSGFEVLPLALLDRPRIDVTLRISGLFRDAFADAVALFDALVHAVAARDEAADWNPLVGQLAGQLGGRALLRVYGAPAGQYGAGDGSGAGWLAASAGAYGRGHDGAPDPDGLRARVAAADAFVHAQDHAETDLLDSPDWAAHEGGFAQAAAALGAAPALYHLDTSRPEAPRPRLVADEVRRVVRGRAANPQWVAGMMRHGFRGAAEIARPLAALCAYAHALPARFDAQFDLLHAATLGEPDVEAFLRATNPAALADMLARFEAARRDGLWHPRSNTAAFGAGAAP